MRSSYSSLNKFVAASLLLHLGFLGVTKFVIPKKERLIPVEISFGNGNTRGGSSPDRPSLKAHKSEAHKKIVQTPTKAIRSLNKVQTDTSVVAKKAEVQDEVNKSSSSITQSGNGRGTTSGSGSGTTSGAGAGFKDPKVKYRGLVRQLVDSQKKYPRKAKLLEQEGIVVAKITLSKDGKLLDVEIVDGSPYESLSEATIEAIKSIKNYPKIPDEYGESEITLTIPFNYGIKNGDFI